MAVESQEQIGLPFQLCDYDPHYTRVAQEVGELIEDGKLPFDTLFRLASVGYKTGRGTSTYLNYIMMANMVKHVDTPTKMRSDVQALLDGELPDAIVDVNSSYNYPAYSKLEPLYYRKEDLVNAIHKRRVASGQALVEAPYDRRLHVRSQEEISRCRGIARPLWHLLVRRFHPEWLETPGDYFPSGYIGHFCVSYQYSEASQRYGVVTRAVFSDPLVMSIYEEATTTGVKGIGPMGKEDLRLLLSDEHPELLEGHELPSD